jgi:tetratricopeptide (TPR) repeat protein
VVKYRAELAKTYQQAGWWPYQGWGEPQTAYLRRACELLRDLVRDFPGDPGYRHQLAINLRRLADTAGFEDRKNSYLEAIGLEAKLASEFPTVPEYRASLAGCHNELGICYSREDDRKPAAEHFHKGLEIFTKLTADFPDVIGYQENMSASENNVAAVTISLGEDLGQARKLLESAIGRLERLVKDYPNNEGFAFGLTCASYLLSDTLSCLGQTPEANRRQKQAEQVFNQTLKRLCQLPEQQSAAFSFCNDLTWELRDHALGWRAAGKADLAERSTARSIKFWSQLREIQPAWSAASEPRDSLAFAHRTLAEILAQKKQPQAAIKEYREAIAGWEKLAADFRDKPEFRQHLAWSYGYLAGVLKESKQADEEEKVLSKAVRLFEELGADFPKHAEYRSWQGSHLWQLGAAQAARSQMQDAEKAYRQAHAVFEKLVRDFPNERFYQQELGFTCYVFLGPLLEKAQRPQEAEEVYRKAVAVHEKLVTEKWNAEYATRLRASYEKLTALLKASGKTEKEVRRQAIGFYEKLATANPQIPVYQQELAQLYSQFGEWDKAAAAYTKVIELKPDEKDARKKRGQLASNLQRWGEAIADYSEAIKLERGDWEAWFGRGFAHSGLRQWDKAIADYSEAIRLAPDVHAPWHHRAGLYVHLRQWDKAVADYSKLLEKYPNDFNAWYGRGVGYANVKQPEKAIADLRQAIARGFRDVGHMKNDPVLEPLRSREDFKKLLAELAAKTTGPGIRNQQSDKKPMPK